MDFLNHRSLANARHELVLFNEHFAFGFGPPCTKMASFLDGLRKLFTCTAIRLPPHSHSHSHSQSPKKWLTTTMIRRSAGKSKKIKKESKLRGLQATETRRNGPQISATWPKAATYLTLTKK